MGTISRRAVVVGAGAAGGAALGWWARGESVPVGRMLGVDPSEAPPVVADGPAILNDASLLEPTPVARHLVLRDTAGEAEAALRAEIAAAKEAGRPFVAHSARHTMGGQSLARDGTAVTLAQAEIEPDVAAGTYRVAAGTRWSDVIAALDAIGHSPKVMQSNNDFAVGSTFCVNAHGWPAPWSGFGSTVRSIRLMEATGEVIEASREREPERFALAMGGYGLTGVVTELEVEMVPNRRLVPEFTVFDAREFGTRMVEALSDPAVEMAYGRMDVAIGAFFEEAMLISYRPDAEQSDLPPASGSGFVSRRSRDIFRAQLGSDRVKALRWWIETDIGPRLGGAVTRNSLLNEPVATLDDRDPSRTDILHEYFVPPERFGEFVGACRDVIPSSFQELLNVTLRFVDTDGESVLAYAPTPRIAAVMLFSQEMSVRAEADMARMTGELIERTLALGGSYYLPYRLHATTGQFRRAYGRWDEFVAAKRRLDPALVFRNALWDRYLADEPAAAQTVMVR